MSHVTALQLYRYSVGEIYYMLRLCFGVPIRHFLQMVCPPNETVAVQFLNVSLDSADDIYFYDSHAAEAAVRAKASHDHFQPSQQHKKGSLKL
eukprot:SAG31_NODE_806_length_11957_cov_2.232670_11_plen_93_part_00